MARVSDVSRAVENGAGTAIQPAKNTLHALLQSVNIKKRFEEILGKKAPGFMSSIISVTNQNKLLSSADPNTIISAAAVAASLDLPINPSLGFAHIVPYRDGKTGNVIAQFQLGWRGFVQLAMRSGQYKTMNVAEVYDGELEENNRITGEMRFSVDSKKSNKVVGYVAYYKLINGFEKYLYMTTEQVASHGQRYSKSYGKESGNWKINFDAMAKKTVLKMLLSKFGILSIEMQRAIETDQAVIKEDGTPEYIDTTATMEETEQESFPSKEPVTEVQKEIEFDPENKIGR